MKKLLKVGIIFCLLALLPLYFHAETHLVNRVIDGYTLILSNGQKVRLIGVNTSETNHPKKPVEFFGKGEYLFMKKMVEGKKVRLEYDWRKKDRYGRLLAYVYLPDGDAPERRDHKTGIRVCLYQIPFQVPR